MFSLVELIYGKFLEFSNHYQDIKAYLNFFCYTLNKTYSTERKKVKK